MFPREGPPEGHLVNPDTYTKIHSLMSLLNSRTAIANFVSAFVNPIDLSVCRIRPECDLNLPAMRGQDAEEEKEREANREERRGEDNANVG